MLVDFFWRYSGLPVFEIQLEVRGPDMWENDHRPDATLEMYWSIYT